MDKSLLAKLPPELRNSIYSLVLVEDRPVLIPERHVRHFMVGSWKPPGLLQTWQQIRSEASSLYFGLNIFCMASFLGSADKVLCTWLCLIEPEQRLSLRNVRLGDEFIPAAEVDSIVRRCKAALEYHGMSLPNVRINVEVMDLMADFDDDCYWAGVWAASSKEATNLMEAAKQKKQIDPQTIR